jgi:hypothetical protein
MWGTAALAAGPSYVLVTPETWLSVSPEPTSRRLRARALTGLEGYHDTRAVVLERLGARDGMVHVRTVSAPADLGPEGTPASVSMAPADWPHCYTQPAGLAQLELDAWVAEDELLDVLTQQVVLDRPEGARLVLEAGLALKYGRNGRYRVVAEHLDINVTLDPAVIGRAYGSVDRGRLPAISFAAGDGVDRYRAHPRWRGRVSEAPDGVRMVAGSIDGVDKGAHSRLSDRCVDALLSEPARGVPEAPTRLSLEPHGVFMVPEGSSVVWDDGVPVAQVAEGGAALWSIGACAPHEDWGACCTSVPGLESRQAADAKLCFSVALPENHASSWRPKIMDDMYERVMRKSKAAGATVAWGVRSVVGSIEASDVRELLIAHQSSLDYCYERTLAEDPEVVGAAQMRLALTGDGQVKGTRVAAPGYQEDGFGQCIDDLMRTVLVPDQIGMPPSAVVVDLELRPPDDGDDATLAD